MGQQVPDVLVFDGHEYVNTKRFLDDLRRHPRTAGVPMVVLGPAHPTAVPHYSGVVKLGHCYDLHQVIEAVQRAAEGA